MKVSMCAIRLLSFKQAARYLLTYRIDGSIAHVWIRIRRVGPFTIDGSIEWFGSITSDRRIQYLAISIRARDGD